MADKIEALKLKLKSQIKLRLLTEREAIELRNSDRSLGQDLTITQNEIEHLKETLKELNSKISAAHHQISAIEICKASEQVKVEAYIKELNNHKKGFDDLIDIEKQKVELQKKEQRDKELEQEALKIQRQLELNAKNERQLQEVLAIEAECDDMDLECTVLKKKNAAIMLTLKRQLVEAENIRQDLLKKKTHEETSGKSDAK